MDQQLQRLVEVVVLMVALHTGVVHRGLMMEVVLEVAHKRHVQEGMLEQAELQVILVMVVLPMVHLDQTVLAVAVAEVVDLTCNSADKKVAVVLGY
jgi:hypothetical protein